MYMDTDSDMDADAVADTGAIHTPRTHRHKHTPRTHRHNHTGIVHSLKGKNEETDTGVRTSTHVDKNTWKQPQT